MIPPSQWKAIDRTARPLAPNAARSPSHRSTWNNVPTQLAAQRPATNTHRRSAQPSTQSAPPAPFQRPSQTAPPAPLQRPAMLRPGDTIALISPASPIPTAGRTVENVLASLRDRLTQWGLHTVVAPHATDAHGYLAGTDAARARDLMDNFLNPDIDAIWCLNGGYGTPRILDRLDYHLIARHPKVFIGYSDITALHTALRQKANLVTFLGPLAYELAFPFRTTNPAADAFTWEWLHRAIMEPSPLGPLPTRTPWQSGPMQTIVPGTAHGPLVGGNLSLLSNTMGTPYELDTTDTILLIEDVNEAPYRIDRMLTQLRLAGKLQAAKGFIFAECINCGPPSPTPGNFTLRQILHDIIVPFGKPTVYGLAAGHGPGRLTLPLGVTTTVDGDNARVVVDESGVVANKLGIRYQ